MDNERMRTFCLALPHVTESVNWGHHLVFWVGDKAIGGKMFAVLDLDGSGNEVVALHCGQERFPELVEMEGIIPAPYSAKHFWVAMERFDVLRAREWEEELRRAHELIYAKLPKRTKTVLAMPAKERQKLIRERRKLLADKEKAKKA
jgi:predicted DNA-binding protein (MmcQ/YjbR family)